MGFKRRQSVGAITWNTSCTARTPGPDYKSGPACSDTLCCGCVHIASKLPDLREEEALLRMEVMLGGLWEG